MKKVHLVAIFTPEANKLLEPYEPLIRRAARFGVYWWLEFLAFMVAWIAVEVATGSTLAGWIFAFIGSLFMDSKAADRERVIECWAKEAKW